MLRSLSEYSTESRAWVLRGAIEARLPGSLEETWYRREGRVAFAVILALFLLAAMAERLGGGNKARKP